MMQDVATMLEAYCLDQNTKQRFLTQGFIQDFFYWGEGSESMHPQENQTSCLEQVDAGGFLGGNEVLDVFKEINHRQISLGGIPVSPPPPV